MGKYFRTALVLAGLAGVCPFEASAQPPSPPAAAAQGETPIPPGVLTRTPCGNELRAPEHIKATPPAGSTFIWMFDLCFPEQDGFSNIESETYLYYAKFPSLLSKPGEGVWSPWTEQAEQVAKEDFKTLMRNTTFLEDLRIERADYTFPNGAVGIIVSYIGEERERIKIVDYRDGKGEPIKVLKRSDIDEKLREKNIQVRLDSFVDNAMIRRVESVLDEMMTEKGFANARVSHTFSEVAGGAKLVNLSFVVAEGPKDKIRRVDWIGNTAMSDGKLTKTMKENKPKGNFFTLGFLKGGGTWKETAFEEDAARVVDFYQRNGYARARVGSPEVKVLQESKDGETRWIELRIPLTEGPRYRMGELSFEGNKVATSEGLKSLYKMKPGDWYSRKKLYDGFRVTQEVYGARGYMEWTPAPMFKYSDDPDPFDQALTSLVPAMLLAPEEPAATKTGVKKPDPIVDVNVLFQEGPQYFVNRITFTGNTTTRDNVIRREMRLFEGGVFDTQALKYSVRRLNQLGYFTEIHGDDRDTKIDKDTARPNTVDVTMKLSEQNRNQLTFGAGVSQYEGVFGQLSFQTSNFLGRGESLTVNMTAGDRSQNYQLAFSEPFLFDRNITGGFDLFRRSLDYIGYYTQKSAGGNLMIGFPVADFSRMFFQYSYESIKIGDLNEALLDQSCFLRETGCGTITSRDQLTDEQLAIVNRNPFFAESLLLGSGGTRTISKITPSFVHNTVDNPIFPNQGKKLTAGIDLAVLGGNTRYFKPTLELVYFKRHLARTSVGFRAQTQYIRGLGQAPCFEDPTQMCRKELPIFERLTLGGEYSLRGFDLRSVGPTVQDSIAVLGGNKSLLFNAEYLISIASQVRFVLFYDAGQVRDVGQGFAWKEDLKELVQPPAPPLIDLYSTSSLVPPGSTVTTQVIGRTSAFKTSTGVELRFFMPVLNVPFRLIYAWNPQRGGVLDNTLRPQKDTTFRFAVGTTF